MQNCMELVESTKKQAIFHIDISLKKQYLIKKFD